MATPYYGSSAPEPEDRFTRCAQRSTCPNVTWDGSNIALSTIPGGLGPVPLLQLIGTRKGGTTALSDHLLKHPNLLKPHCEEHKREWSAKIRNTMCVWDKEARRHLCLRGHA